MVASTYSISHHHGWSVKPSSSSPWNAGILLDVPNIMNQYPPGLNHGAWRMPSASYSTSSDKDIATGSKRPRPPHIRSGRRAPPPPPPSPLSRLQPVPVAFPSDDDLFLGELSSEEQDENYYYSPNVVIYRSPNNQSRIRLPIQPRPESAGYSYPMRQVQSVEELARQRAAADKEARLRVIASILLNRVNVVGKPMRRKPRLPGLDEPKMYVKSGLGRCISVAE